MKEIWKPIFGYEGFYEISNCGRVRSLDREIVFKNGNKRKYIGKILKQKYHNGYAMVNLNKNKKCEVVYVHQLVAKHFIGNIPKGMIVKHKDGIKSNNNVFNLEYVSSVENNIHANQLGLHENNTSDLKKYTDTLKKKIACIKDNKIIFLADCSRDAAKEMLRIGLIKEVSIETASRAIRKSATTGKPYKNYNFQYID